MSTLVDPQMDKRLLNDNLMPPKFLADRDMILMHLQLIIRQSRLYSFMEDATAPLHFFACVPFSECVTLNLILNRKSQFHLQVNLGPVGNQLRGYTAISDGQLHE
ncbi:uncharacterized protein APUU_20133S [Aspergillus puulaauensis]|uniref:Uncharacterized protein n=1 Tax=Aspergillus puulaauensis TaxID=1220207 RepID=A0A7R7XEH2_9EURO|nr:uncharacterized protein APUU_20133S [Aspergillus puulaauensis]BCS19701.1 hypothetical protein APUU_20133S [Aspergillus puulaauensis]